MSAIATAAAPAREVQRLRIPGLVKRNMALLALSMAFTGVGHHLVYALSPLMVLALLHSATLAGIGLSIIGLSRFAVAYPVGKLTDAWGRKPGLMLGMGLGLVGAVLAGFAMVLQSPALYFVSMLTLGMGIAASHQMRVAAADMFPPTRRAEAIGYVLTGALVGTIGSPLLVLAAQTAAPSLGVDAIGLAWWLAPVLGLPGLWLIWLVRPDPKEIGAHLERYYRLPSPPLKAREGVGGDTPGSRMETAPAPAPSPRVGITALLDTYPRRLAAIASFAAQANMSIVMVIMGVGLLHHGHHLAAISVSQALHTIGMFGLSLPIGYLVDAFGRRKLMLAGAAVETAGAYLVGLTPDYWTIALGGFLVGVGWCGVNVSATALVVDTTSAGERGRGVGMIDTFSAAGVLLPALVAGPVVEGWGVGAAGLIAVAFTLPAILLALPLRELSPGRYG